MACRCPRRGLTAPAPSPDSPRIVVDDHVLWRAQTDITETPVTIHVDRAWWAGLDPLARLAVTAHELAHHERGCASGLESPASGCPAVACEACADRRAGAILRAWGASVTATHRAFRGAVRSRADAALDAVEGWQAMDAHLGGA